MSEVTSIQPNFRQFRALRQLQGIDYLMSLRGVQEITFYDFDHWLREGKKIQVRDFTFIQDVLNSVCRDKEDDKAILSQWRRLAPTVGGFTPNEAVWQALERALDGGVPAREQFPLPDDRVPMALNAAAIVIDGDEESSTENNQGSDSDLANDGDVISGHSGDDEFEHVFFIDDGDADNGHDDHHQNNVEGSLFVGEEGFMHID